MKLNHFIKNQECIGRSFTAWLETPDNISNEKNLCRYGSSGQILYMHGESVRVAGINEEVMMVSMQNDQNTKGYENFSIPFAQFQGDFGQWPPSQP